MHDHLVSGVFAQELVDVATENRAPRTSDEFAEYFEEEFSRIRELHYGVTAADLSHKDVGLLLPLIDTLPYTEPTSKYFHTSTATARQA